MPLERGLNRKPLLKQATEFAFAKLDEAGGDLNRLPTHLQTVVVITTMQGIVDNGGLEYLFSSDLPGRPDYSLLSEAYRRIGAVDAAECIEATVVLFPFPEPHLFVAKTMEFLAIVEKDPAHAFNRLSKSICGDESVWKQLEVYLSSNLSSFQ